MHAAPAKRLRRAGVRSRKIGHVNVGSGAVMAKRIDFQTEPARYRHWKLKFDGEVAELIMDVDENAGPVRGLSAQAQLLRPRRRHRACRCRAAAAVRASGGEGGGAEVRQGPRVLRRRQHPHAGRLHPRAQGQLLQVHQRDAQLDGGCQRQLRPEVPVRHSRHGRRRRLRAGAGNRPHHAGRRRQFDRVAARAAAAGGAARHRRSDPRHRQAQGAPRPGRCLLHRGRRRARHPRRQVAPGRPVGVRTRSSIRP